jgi:hypothetical protein
MSIAAFAVTGSLCLFAALFEAWALVALFASPDGKIQKLLPGREDLVRSHIDYLMMALFLYAFYGLSRLLGAPPPVWAIAAACLGAFFNPFGFLVHATRPDFKEAPPPWFFISMVTSCVATTIGFAVTAATITAAVI